MLAQVRKRFYERVSVEAEEGGFVVHLDGKTLRTPAKKPLILPSRSLADALAAEWQAQSDSIVPATMPLMQLVSTALDRIVPHRNAVMDEMMRYAETDLLCYRAGHPAELTEIQARRWQPLLDWAAEQLGARMVVTEGLIAVAQPTRALLVLRQHLEGLSLWQLTAAQSLTAACGSLILSLATVAGRVSGETAWELALLDELYQNERWGEDWEATERRAVLRRDILAAEQLVRLTAGC